MLPEKPWRVEAVMRLLLRVILIVMLGALLTAVIAFLRQADHPSPVLFGTLTLGSAAFSLLALKRLHREWNPDTLTRDLGMFLFFLYVGLVLGMFALKYIKTGTDDYPAWRVLIGALSLQGSAVLLTIPLAREHGLKWADAFGFKENWPRALGWGVVAILILTPAMLGLQELCVWLMNRLGHEATPQAAVQALQVAVSGLDRFALGVVAIVLAPLSEELVFRGILYPTVKRLGYPRLALWGTSLFFAAIHANLPIFLPLFLLAMALTLLYEKTGNLLAPIAAHGLFNAINFAMFYLTDSPSHPLH